MGRNDQVIVFEEKIGDLGVGEILAHGLPFGSIIERNVDTVFCSGEKEAGALGVFTDDVDEIVVGDAVDDFGPGGAVIVGAIGVGTAVIGLVILRGEICGAGLIRRGVDDADADRPGRSLGVTSFQFLPPSRVM